MKKNTFRSAPVRAYNVVAPDGKVVSSWDYREDAAEDLRDNKAAYPAGCRILTERGLRRFKANLAGDLGALNRNPGGAKQRARGTRTVSPPSALTSSWQQAHEREMQLAARSRRGAAKRPAFDHRGEEDEQRIRYIEVADSALRSAKRARERAREQSHPYADELRFEAKHQRAVARAYPFQLRSESGVSESFQSHAEALKWAESNLKKGEFFTISKDSDHFHEHYVKE